MGTREVREPKQERSIEKRKKIVEAGFQLFCEKGYHNTTTVEIAKLAGVSTGIVYNYFEDKKDIFIEAFKVYVNSVATPIYTKFSEIEAPIDITKLLREIISMIIKSHNIAKSAHEEMQAMAHTDPNVAEFFCEFQANIANTIVESMSRLGITPSHAYEKTHILFNIIENLCHEIVYHKHDYINYDVMTEEAIKIIVTMLLS